MKVESRKSKVGSKNGQARKPLTAAQKARDRAIRAQYAHKPGPDELMATGEYEPLMLHEDYFGLMRLVVELKRCREAAGLSAAAVAREMEVDGTALAKLEKGDNGNPTIRTLTRWARAVGYQLTFGLKKEGDGAQRTGNRPRKRKVRT